MNTTETIQTQSNTDVLERLTEALEGLPVEVLGLPLEGKLSAELTDEVLSDAVILLIDENGFHDAKKEGFPFHGRSCPDEIIDALTSAGFKAHRLPKPIKKHTEYKTGYTTLNNGLRHEFLIEDVGDDEWDLYERGVILKHLNKLPDEALLRMADMITGCFSKI